MSAPAVMRTLTCPTCGRTWHPIMGESVFCPGCGVQGVAGGISPARVCEHCGRQLTGKRRDARYCDSTCRADATRVRQELSGGSQEALRSAASDREGSRGGNVRDLDTARALQEEAKGRWTLIVREQIARTLIETGYFHADDLDELGIPAEHCNLIGSQIASFANRKLMESTGVTRKVAHRAANGRRAPIYCITDKGREELAGVGAGNREGTAGREKVHAHRTLDRPASTGVRSSSDPDSGETSSAPPAGEAPRLFTPPAQSAVTHPEAA